MHVYWSKVKVIFILFNVCLHCMCIQVHVLVTGHSLSTQEQHGHSCIEGIPLTKLKNVILEYVDIYTKIEKNSYTF